MNNYNVEEALRGALEVTFKVRAAKKITDVVCLRLRSCMLDNDPILLADNHAVEKRWNAVRATKLTKQAAQGRARLQM